MESREEHAEGLAAEVERFCRENPSLATRKGAFSRCRTVSARLMERLSELGYSPVAIRLAECTASYPEADPRWRRLGSEFWWVHYAVRVDGFVLDCTARQFDPAAPFPAVLPLEEVMANWQDVCEVDIGTGERIRPAESAPGFTASIR